MALGFSADFNRPLAALASSLSRPIEIGRRLKPTSSTIVLGSNLIRDTKRPSSVHVQFLRDVLAADLDFAFVLAGCGEVIGKLHPQPRLLRAAERSEER